MLSQSGALGLAILDYAKARNIGLSTFVSVGNKTDVSSNDLLAYWAEDERTGVIVLHLESFGNPRKFARVAPEVARRKPIVAVKSGRSAAGTRAAASHSASLASLDVAVEALFEHAGVIRSDTFEELFYVIELLSSQPVPDGGRVGIVTNARGPAILAADTCESRGLELPPLTKETLETRAFLPARAGLGNSVDMIASASPEDYARTIAAVAADPDIDSVVAMHVPTMVSVPEKSDAESPEAPPMLRARSRWSSFTSHHEGRRRRCTPARAACFPATPFPKMQRSRSPPPLATRAGGGGLVETCSRSIASRWPASAPWSIACWQSARNRGGFRTKTWRRSSGP
jgi:acetate---CoA ligase (ADP-forming)